jgi:hypothetical protein
LISVKIVVSEQPGQECWRSAHAGHLGREKKNSCKKKKLLQINI